MMNSVTARPLITGSIMSRVTTSAAGAGTARFRACRLRLGQRFRCQDRRPAPPTCAFEPSGNPRSAEHVSSPWLPDQRSNGLQELSLVEFALDEVGPSADLRSSPTVLHSIPGGDQDGGGIAQSRIEPGMTHKLEAVHAEHLDIDDEEAVATIVSLRECIPGRDGELNLVARR